MKDTEVKRLLYQDSEAFKEGVEIGKKEMLEKTISWFYKNGHKQKYWDKDGCLLITVLMNDYRQAMEEYK